MKLQLRELKATRPTMPSQGLGPRQSVLPLLISFLFSHIVLAELAFPLSPHILLLPLSFLFSSSFSLLFFLPFSLHISPRSLSLSLGLCLISHRGNSRVRFAPRGRKFLFPFLAKVLFSFRVFAIDQPDMRHDFVPWIHTCWSYRAAY